jgi:hypothetical protein
VGYADALRAIPRDETRLRLLAFLTDAGFRPVDIDTARPPREGLLEAMVRTEDWLELERPKWPERDALKAVRRSLEVELWP